MRGEAGGGHGDCTDGPRRPSFPFPPPPPTMTPPPGPRTRRHRPTAGLGGGWGAAVAAPAAGAAPGGRWPLGRGPCVYVPCRAVPCGAASSAMAFARWWYAMVNAGGRLRPAEGSAQRLRVGPPVCGTNERGGGSDGRQISAVHVLVLLCVRSCENLWRFLDVAPKFCCELCLSDAGTWVRSC